MNKRLSEKIEAECKAIDTDARYDDLLDEIYDFKSVGGPFTSMSPSSVLREVDPTAYRCGKNDWEDGESRDGGWVTIDNGSTYYERDDCETARGELADEIAGEVTELRAELEAVEGDDIAEEKERSELQAKIDALEKEETKVRDEDFSD